MNNSNWLRERVEDMHCININHKTWNGFINITQSGLPNKNCLLDKVQIPLCQGQATDEEESRGEVRQCCQLNHNEDSGISSCGHDSGQRAGELGNSKGISQTRSVKGLTAVASLSVS